jgi:hypothetical protein
MACYFSEHVCILFDMACHFSEHFVLRSEAALYFSDNLCVSINTIRYFRHLLLHPDRTCYLKKLFHHDITCYFREHLFCSTWHDVLLWRTLRRFILIWYTIPANICCFPFGVPFYFSKLSLMYFRVKMQQEAPFNVGCSAKSDVIGLSFTYSWFLFVNTDSSDI